MYNTFNTALMIELQYLWCHHTYIHISLSQTSYPPTTLFNLLKTFGWWDILWHDTPKICAHLQAKRIFTTKISIAPVVWINAILMKLYPNRQLYHPIYIHRYAKLPYPPTILSNKLKTFRRWDIFIHVIGASNFLFRSQTHSDHEQFQSFGS